TGVQTCALPISNIETIITCWDAHAVAASRSDESAGGGRCDLVEQHVRCAFAQAALGDVERDPEKVLHPREDDRPGDERARAAGRRQTSQRARRSAGRVT